MTMKVGVLVLCMLVAAASAADIYRHAAKGRNAVADHAVCDSCNTVVDNLLRLDYGASEENDYAKHCHRLSAGVRENCDEMFSLFPDAQMLVSEEPSQACMHMRMCPLDMISDADTLLSDSCSKCNPKPKTPAFQLEDDDEDSSDPLADFDTITRNQVAGKKEDPNMVGDILLSPNGAATGADAIPHMDELESAMAADYNDHDDERLINHALLRGDADDKMVADLAEHDEAPLGDLLLDVDADDEDNEDTEDADNDDEDEDEAGDNAAFLADDAEEDDAEAHDEEDDDEDADADADEDSDDDDSDVPATDLLDESSYQDADAMDESASNTAASTTASQSQSQGRPDEEPVNTSSSDESELDNMQAEMDQKVGDLLVSEPEPEPVRRDTDLEKEMYRDTAQEEDFQDTPSYVLEHKSSVDDLLIQKDESEVEEPMRLNYNPEAEAAKVHDDNDEDLFDFTA